MRTSVVGYRARMADDRTDRHEGDPEELADEIVEHNRDPQTRREAFELELIDHDESEAGEAIEVSEAPTRADRPRSR